jgi:hypothetical protein
MPERDDQPGQPDKRDLRALGHQVLQLKRTGATLRDVAQALGISRSAAGRLYKREMARLRSEGLALAEFSVIEERDRLERLTLAVNRRLTDPDLPFGDFIKAVRALVDIAVRKARLLGLDQEPKYTRPADALPAPARPISDLDRARAITALLQKAGAA